MINKTKSFYQNNVFLKTMLKAIYIYDLFNYLVVILISNLYAVAIKHAFYLRKQMFVYWVLKLISYLTFAIPWGSWF